MSVVVFVLLTLLALIGVAALLACALLYVAGRMIKVAARHRCAQRSMTEREVALTQRPFTEISVWPSRAPTNGITHEGE
jgi:membrane protein DedA with SNARE-associated domain